MSFLKHIPVRLQITTGLIGLMVGTLLMASALGFFPNEQKAILNCRAKLCETLAITGTGMASAGQLGTLKASLEAVVNRDEDVLSIGLRTIDGQLLVVAGPHSEHWRTDYGTGVDQNMVPVFRRGEKWGDLEVCFAGTGGTLGLNYWAPAWLLIVMVPALFIQYTLFLRKTLKHLDPSAGVPQHVQDALDTLSVGLVLLDADHRILFANRVFRQSIEVEEELIDGIELSSLNWEIPGARETDLPWLRVDELTGKIDDQLLQMKVGDRRRSFSINCTTVGNGMMATFDDITLLEEARAAAQQASESKSSFLANMSHEIRTPLNAVLGFTDVLRRGLVTDTDESLDHLNMIHRSGKHLLRLINDILDLSKIEAGRMEVESIETKVGEIIVDTVDVLAVRAREKNLDIRVDFKTAIPRTIQSDPTRLKQIITNLIGNAIKFTDDGSVTVATAWIQGESPQLRIDIIDTGVGMTPDQQGKIFDSFSQADETTTRKFGGTGLGLSISRQLTEALGGQLTVTSEFGRGSTFTITLPLHPDSTGELVSPETILSGGNAADANRVKETIRLPQRSILVVDDGEANRRLIELVIGRAGAKVVTAENGLQAIEKIAEQSFDLIFMDMQMPVLDGYSATARLRSAQVVTPIVALTGNAMKGDREQCMKAGCDDFLTKPVDIDRLLKTTAKYIGYREDEPDDQTKVVSESSTDPHSKPTTQAEIAELSDQPSTDQAPLHSTLPMDDADFRAIVVDFTERLETRLDGINSAIAAADFEIVRNEAHWLKGAGGTVGLGAFTEPAKSLEQAAKEEDGEVAARLLATIQQLHSRIVLPELDPVSVDNRNAEPDQTCSASISQVDIQDSRSSVPVAPPVVCELPFDDPELVQVVCDYVERLDMRLTRMKNYCENKVFDRLADEAHWLKGSGGTVGYAELSVPAAELEQAAKRGSSKEATRAMRAVLDVRCRMVLPEIAESK